MIDILNRRAFR